MTERATGDACSPAANIVTAALDTTKGLSSSQNWVQVTLTANVWYQIYVEKTEGGTAKIDFVCGPDELQIGSTRARPGTGLGDADASLTFSAAAGLHYVKITTTGSGGKTVLVADLSDHDLAPTVAVGGTVTGTFESPTAREGVYVPLVSGKTYQIDLQSVGYPSIDPWIIDIYDGLFDKITRPAGMFGASYDGFFDHDSGPGNAARVVYTATETEDHYIEVGSRGAPSQRLGDWRLTVTEASAPFYDDYAAGTSTTGTVSVGGSVSGEIDSTPSWYNAGDTGGPSITVSGESREPGYTGNHHGFSCHEYTGDGIKLDGNTCDRDWFKVTLTQNRTYKLQLESGTNLGTDVLIADVYHRWGSLLQKGGTTYRARSTGVHYISVAGTDGCSGLHGCTGSYTLSLDPPIRCWWACGGRVVGGLVAGLGSGGGFHAGFGVLGRVGVGLGWWRWGVCWGCRSPGRVFR